MDVFRPTTRRRERGVWAHLSLKPAKRAIVFVHGFAGRGLLTWTRFPDLLQGEPKTADYDLIFFEYDSFGRQLGDIVTRLKTFLNNLMTNASPIVNRGLALPDHRPKGFAYDQVLLVAHSLGAVVTRRTLLDYFGNGTPWVPHATFTLFAPADMGASGTALITEALQGVPFASLGSAAIKTFFPVLRSLEAGSMPLDRLRKDTLTLSKDKNTNPHLRAQLVVFAATDSVVEKEKFLVDEKEGSIPGTTHTTVCKPDDAHTQAIHFLLGLV